MGANISLSPLYAWIPKGGRVYRSVLHNQGPNTTLLASMTSEGMGLCFAVEGDTTDVVFRTYVEKALASSLWLGRW